MGNRGINVPPDPACFYQFYHDSTVEEYFYEEAARDARVSQLQALGRNPVPYFSRVTRPSVREDSYAVRWVEPRGSER